MASDLTGLAGFLELIVHLTAQRALDLGTPEEELRFAIREKISFGSGADQADQLWHDRATIAADGTLNLDLLGELTNSFGQTVNFATVKAVLIHNRSDQQAAPTAAELKIGGGTNEWQGFFGAAGDFVRLKAGAWFIWASPASGYAVGAEASDDLKILETATLQAEVDIILIGTST